MASTTVQNLNASDGRMKTNRPMRIVLRMVLTLVIASVAIAGGAVAYLAFPGTPSRPTCMVFDGFIQLPKEGFLTVLDYLTLGDHMLFATSISTGSVFKIDLNPLNPTASAVALLRGSGSAHGVALVPELKLAFVTRSRANTVDVFDPGSLEPLASIPVADQADAIHYLPSSKLLYVASSEPKLATLIDPAQRATVGTIALPGKPEFAAFDPKTGLLYQNIVDANTVVAIDVNKRTIVGEWSLAPCEGPSGMAIDPTRRHLFSVCAKNATLVAFDLDRHRVQTSIKIGRWPDSVAVDPAGAS